MNPDLHLVVGGDGLLGASLARALADAGQAVVATTRRAAAVGESRPRLDLTDDPAGWTPPAGTTVAWLCAAVTSLARCEAEPAATWRANVDHTLQLAATLAAAGAFVVFPSTNLVFDGTRPRCGALEAVCPQTAYGRQKAAAEAGLLALRERAAVVRLTKVVAPATPLLAGWIQALRAGQPVTAFADLVCAPLPLAWVTAALLHLAEVRAAGLWQLSGERDVAYSELAATLARLLGADPALVTAGSAAAAGVPPAARPAHTTLDDAAWRQRFGSAPPAVETTLAELLARPGGDVPH